MFSRFSSLMHHHLPKPQLAASVADSRTREESWSWAAPAGLGTRWFVYGLYMGNLWFLYIWRWLIYVDIPEYDLVGGWPTSLKNMSSSRQLGWWHYQLNGKIKVMFQSPPTRYDICNRLRYDMTGITGIFVIYLFYPNMYMHILHIYMWSSQTLRIMWCIIS